MSDEMEGNFFLMMIASIMEAKRNRIAEIINGCIPCSRAIFTATYPEPHITADTNIIQLYFNFII